MRSRPACTRAGAAARRRPAARAEGVRGPRARRESTGAAIVGARHVVGQLRLASQACGHARRRSRGSPRSDGATARTAADDRSGRGSGSPRGTPPGRCPPRARCHGRRGTRRGARAASERRTVPRGRRRIRAGRPAPRRARLGLHAPPQDHTSDTTGEVHRNVYGCAIVRRSRGPLGAPSAYEAVMNRRALPGSEPRRGSGARASARRTRWRRIRGARHRRPRVAHRRGRRRLGADRQADPHRRGAAEHRDLAVRARRGGPHRRGSRHAAGRVDAVGSLACSAASSNRATPPPTRAGSWPTSRIPAAATSRRSTLAGGRIVRRTPVPGPARHVTLDWDGRSLWVALGTKAERIAVLDLIDPRRPRLRRVFAPPFPAHDVVGAPDGRHVWVTSGTRDAIAIYPLAGGRPRLLAADAPPQHVGFSDRRAFVASGADGTVRLQRLDGSRVRSIGVPRGSYNVSYGSPDVPRGRPVAVTPSLDEGTLCVLDRGM